MPCFLSNSFIMWYYFFVNGHLLWALIKDYIIFAVVIQELWVNEASETGGKGSPLGVQNPSNSFDRFPSPCWCPRVEARLRTLTVFRTRMKSFPNSVYNGHTKKRAYLPFPVRRPPPSQGHPSTTYPNEWIGFRVLKLSPLHESGGSRCWGNVRWNWKQMRMRGRGGKEHVL